MASFTIARVDIASRAEQSRVLPCFLLVSYLHRNGLLPGVRRTISSGFKLQSGASLQLTSDVGHVLLDREVIEHLADMAHPDTDHLLRSVIASWVQRSFALGNRDERVVRPSLAELDDHLKPLDYTAGHHLGAADMVTWATIRGNPVALPMATEVFRHVSRWYRVVETTNPWVLDVMDDLAFHVALDTARTLAAHSLLEPKYDISLPRQSGPIVTRFSVSPPGHLHLGHARAAILNQVFAKKVKPDGVLICRFNDTATPRFDVTPIPSAEFQDTVIQELALFGIVPDKTSFASDYFPQMREFAMQLIEDGKAFADDDDTDSQLPSEHRDMGVEETLLHFLEMETGSVEGQRWCLRARAPHIGGPCDPVIFRCSIALHPRTGNMWKVYPTAYFCTPVLDAIEGVTLALLVGENHNGDTQYKWVQEALGLPKVDIWRFSRMSIARNVLSKSMLASFVDEGRVCGWDDPRMPTVRGIYRRGVTLPVLRRFITGEGLGSCFPNTQLWKLWGRNSHALQAVAPRHTAVVVKEAVYCDIRGVGEPGVIVKPKRPHAPELGTKKVVTGRRIVVEQADAQNFAQGDEIALVGWSNAVVQAITWDSRHQRVVSMELRLNLKGSAQTARHKINWLAETEANMVPVDLVSFDHLLIKDELTETDVLEDFLTSVTECRTRAWADCNVADLVVGARISFEGKGYFRLDSCGSRMVFFEIPPDERLEHILEQRSSWS